MSEALPPVQKIAHDRIVAALDTAEATYYTYTHRPVLNYDDAERARLESGFTGTENKSMVLKSGDSLFVYVTLAGRRVISRPCGRMSAARNPD